MKRLAVVLAVVLGAWLVVDALADLTQDRPDRASTSERSEVVFAIQTRSGEPAELAAAQAVWAICQTTVPNEPLGSVADVDTATFRVVLTPAVGEHGERRLRGCIEDALLDHMQATVVVVRAV